MSIVLFGADGQLGYQLQRSLSALDAVHACTRSGRLPGGFAGERVDFSEPDQAAALIRRLRPRAVVNAVAYTAVDRAEDEPQLAQRINADAVAEIAAACAHTGSTLLHYSTDYVFSGVNSRPWREDDATGPLSVYGQTKLAGEGAIRASGCQYLIFRTAWVYAARGSNFLRTMLRLAAERDELRIVSDQIGSPTSARWLADISTLALHAAPETSGTWHAVAAGQCSWAEFAEAICADALAVGLIARAPTVTGIASSDYPTRATRPAYSVLDTTRLRSDFSLTVPDWRCGLQQVIAEMMLARS
ncbi:MAG: dTDP-4-dehydrorhamnose reductase [Lysobacterales bacterium CG17_big_fil_post_rev_8_21_14_2_50_64_11]|nr:MAG: dTDP-4-dehydrorhamnose reductase [Xanthomonadales bacterium CG17_big_fil_post_rev_8_21_14_2_50_64_11]PIX61195.1 MAG: dTDP-4-dehydrorhamnose reductase [Xanthomonadales bacterium CG_4_10_14_3_um_filter_64_11]